MADRQAESNETRSSANPVLLTLRIYQTSWKLVLRCIPQSLTLHGFSIAGWRADRYFAQPLTAPKQLNIGLIGAGMVGGGVAKLLTAKVKPAHDYNSCITPNPVQNLSK